MTAEPAALVLERIGPGATVQDLGRPGRMHEGIPPGGALWPELFVATNRALGNAPGAAAVELPLHGAALRARGALLLAIDGVPTFLPDGGRLEVPPGARAVRYVAVAGGIDVPEVLGGRGTLLVAGIGGHAGRALARGDVLAAARGDGTGGAPPPAARAEICAEHAFESETTSHALRVVLGPDVFPREEVAALLGRTFRVGRRGDRVGMRLEGGLSPRGADLPFSAPMVRGAIQVTRDGELVVLGPDHPTTGGYPVIAVVCTRDLGTLASRRPGAPLRFVVDGGVGACAGAGC